MPFTKFLRSTLAVSVLTAGCAGIPYDPRTTSDSTPPDIGIRVEGQDQTSTYNPNPAPTDTQCFPKKSEFCPDIRITPVDVGVLALGTPNVVVQIHERGEASVLATAQDTGSGIQMIKLSCQRRVYYNWDAVNQTESDVVIVPVDVSQRNNQISNGRVPSTGILQRTMNMRTQMIFTNGAGTITRGHRVAVTCSAEAQNFSGFSAQSHGVVIVARDRSIQP